MLFYVYLEIDISATATAWEERPLKFPIMLDKLNHFKIADLKVAYLYLKDNVTGNVFNFKPRENGPFLLNGANHVTRRR